MAVIPALNLKLVNGLGWQGAYATLGLAAWAVMLPLILLYFRNRPEDVGQTLDGLPRDEQDRSHQRVNTDDPGFTLGQALRTRSFWIVVSGTAASALLQTAVFFGLIPIFLDRHLSEADAVGMLSAFAISLAAMHVIGGVLADRFAAPMILATALGLLTGSMFMPWSMSTSWAGHLSGIAMGVAQGLYFGTSNPLWARYFGRLHLGKIRVVLMTANVGASSLGPLLIGVGCSSGFLLCRGWPGLEALRSPGERFSRAQPAGASGEAPSSPGHPTIKNYRAHRRLPRCSRKP